MPRKARIKSTSGFYHVLLRGIGQQNIFEDDEDRQHFIEILQRYKQEQNFQIHAYCLMGNHVHLLLKDINDKLDLILKKIAGSYAYYFNWKYERVGHLFQDRFQSEAVEDDTYYLTVLRYIHQNPAKAGISLIDKYPWSSYQAYILATDLVNTSFALGLLGDIEKYIKFMHEANEITCLEISNKKRLTDEMAIDFIKNRYKIKSIQEVQGLVEQQRNEILRRLKEEGFSIRQIARLTGINRGIVFRV